MTLVRSGAYPLPHDAVDQFSVAATGGRMRVPQQLRPPPFASQGRVIGHGNMWAQRGSHNLQPAPARVPSPTMGRANLVESIGPATTMGGLFDAITVGLDILSGGPQKREREAKALRDAAQATADAQVRTALIQAQMAEDASAAALEAEKQKGKTLVMVVGAAGLVVLATTLIATRKRK